MTTCHVFVHIDLLDPILSSHSNFFTLLFFFFFFFGDKIIKSKWWWALVNGISLLNVRLVDGDERGVDGDGNGG
jgi:hypothetical protein